jgi:hypothetical protein
LSEEYYSESLRKISVIVCKTEIPVAITGGF